MISAEERIDRIAFIGFSEAGQILSRDLKRAVARHIVKGKYRDGGLVGQRKLGGLWPSGGKRVLPDADCTRRG